VLIKVEGGNIRLKISKVAPVSEKTVRQIVERNNCYLQKILSTDSEGNIRVDWRLYKEMVENTFYQQKESVKVSINLILLAAGILTAKLDGAWTFSDESMNPFWGLPADHGVAVSHLGQLYFVQKADILDYSRSWWKDKIFGWRIFQAKNVLEKQEVLK